MTTKTPPRLAQGQVDYSKTIKNRRSGTVTQFPYGNPAVFVRPVAFRLRLTTDLAIILRLKFHPLEVQLARNFL